MRFLVDGRRDRNRFAPIVRGMDVHFDDARIGCDLDDVDPGIVRRRVAFDVHARTEFGRRAFDGAEQFEVIGRRFRRRHKDTQAAVARLDE